MLLMRDAICRCHALIIEVCFIYGVVTAGSQRRTHFDTRERACRDARAARRTSGAC